MHDNYVCINQYTMISLSQNRTRAYGIFAKNRNKSKASKICTKQWNEFNLSSCLFIINLKSFPKKGSEYIFINEILFYFYYIDEQLWKKSTIYNLLKESPVYRYASFFLFISLSLQLLYLKIKAFIYCKKCIYLYTHISLMMPHAN